MKNFVEKTIDYKWKTLENKGNQTFKTHFYNVEWNKLLNECQGYLDKKFEFLDFEMIKKGVILNRLDQKTPYFIYFGEIQKEFEEKIKILNEKEKNRLRKARYIDIPCKLGFENLCECLVENENFVSENWNKKCPYSKYTDKLCPHSKDVNKTIQEMNQIP